MSGKWIRLNDLVRLTGEAEEHLPRWRGDMGIVIDADGFHSGGQMLRVLWARAGEVKYHIGDSLEVVTSF